MTFYIPNQQDHKDSSLFAEVAVVASSPMHNLTDHSSAKKMKLKNSNIKTQNNWLCAVCGICHLPSLGLSTSAV